MGDVYRESTSDELCPIINITQKPEKTYRRNRPIKIIQEPEKTHKTSRAIEIIQKPEKTHKTI